MHKEDEDGNRLFRCTHCRAYARTRGVSLKIFTVAPVKIHSRRHMLGKCGVCKKESFIPRSWL